MQSNQITPGPNTPPPTDNAAQQNAHGGLTIQPLSSEDTIREAAARTSAIVTPSAVLSPASERAALNVEPEISNDYSANAEVQQMPMSQVNSTPAYSLIPITPSERTGTPQLKKHRVSFIIFLLLSIAQIYWLGDLANGTVTTLDGARLVGFLASALLACVVLFRYVQLYRSNGFSLVTWKEKIYTGLAVLPVATYALCMVLMLIAIQFRGFQLSLILLAGMILASQLALLILIVSAIGLGVIVHKRTGIRRILHLWPLLLIFLAGIITVLLVGGTQGSQLGVVEKTQLEQAKANMSSYLANKYGMQFNVQDIRFMKEIKSVSGTKVVTAKVSPVKDPGFSYSANVYLHKSISMSTGEMKDDPTYREDFMGEYWKSGFENAVCPTIRSFQKSFDVTVCTVTHYNLSVDYNDALAKHRGNIPTYTQLNENERELINFGLTVESSDDKNIENTLKHVEFVKSVVSSIQNTHSTGDIMYFSNASNENAPRLGYLGTTDTSTPGGKRTVQSLIFEQDAKKPKTAIASIIDKNKRYYNPETRKFDLSKPLEE